MLQVLPAVPGTRVMSAGIEARSSQFKWKTKRCSLESCSLTMVLLSI